MKNKCPVCHAEHSLILTISAYNENSGQDEADVQFKLTGDLKVIETELPDGVCVYDKDRNIICDACGEDSSYNDDLYKVRVAVKARNPDYL